MKIKLLSIMLCGFIVLNMTGCNNTLEKSRKENIKIKKK